jgi:uncharacterized protein YuzE
MKISYDPEVDAMYIQLVEGEQECRTVRLSDEVALDFGDDEKLVGIEILDAKQLIGKGKLPRLVVDNVAMAAPRGTPSRRAVKPAAARPGPRVRKAG